MGDFLTTVWRTLLFVPVMFLLFLLGTAKGIIVGPVTFVVLVVGNTALIIGLWPVNVGLTYYTIAKTKQLGRSAKVLSFLSLPVPSILLPFVAIAACILVGLGYGFVTPLVATFEAVGAGRERKTYHCFVDGTWSTLKGSCTVVRDFKDLAMHSYPDYLKDFREKPPKLGQPYDIKKASLFSYATAVLCTFGLFRLYAAPLLKVFAQSNVGSLHVAEFPVELVPELVKINAQSSLEIAIFFSPSHRLLEVPGCILVAVLGVLLDVPVMTVTTLVKSPIMLLKGWKRLLNDLWGRQGPFLEAVCVPFAGLAIVLWPLVVVASCLCALFASPLLGLYAGVVVYQERSIKMGLAYVVNVMAQFDEYTNDVLHLSEGSCFPRPKYRSHDHNSGPDVVMPKSSPLQQRAIHQLQPDQLDSSGVPISTTEHKDGLKVGEENSPSSSRLSRLSSQVSLASRSLRQTLQEVKVVQIWDNLFRNMDSIGKELVRAGVLKTGDLEEWLRAPKRDRSRLISVGLPAYSSLSTLIYSAKNGVAGILLHDGTEVTVFNRPQDRVADWIYEPLLVLKEQIRAATLTPGEEQYIKNWILTSGDQKMMESWRNGGVEPEDNIRRGELQAMCRRLQGITVNYSRMPTFPRRLEKFIRHLLLFAQSNSNLPPNPLPPSLPSIPVPVGDEAV